MNRPVVVIGDALLDIDVVGESSRLCPDAPAPVVDVGQEVLRPGGAALAATMAAADGHQVVLVTPLADDADARRLIELLPRTVRLLRLKTDAVTAVKRRVRVAGQTLARLDTGSRGRIADDVPGELEAVLEDAAAVLVSDYGRGTTSHLGVRRRLSAMSQRIPLVWDPHPRGAVPVRGCRVVTPNAAEARQFATDLPALQAMQGVAAGQVPVAERDAAALVRAWEAASVVVTMGPLGALLSYGDGPPTVIPAATPVRGDTCGAGDRFASRMTTLLADGAVMLEAVAGATAAATDFVARGGPEMLAGPTPQLASRVDIVASVRAAGGVVVATGGCFDLLHAGHIASLRAARSLGDCLVVCLNSDASVRRLKGPPRPLVPAADRARVLEALSCVDAVVIFDEDSPAEALEDLRPDLWVKGGDYAGTALPEEEVLSRWGGRAVVVPYLQGRSTSRLVASMGTLTTSEPKEQS